jgi:hypothetical protein
MPINFLFPQVRLEFGKNTTLRFASRIDLKPKIRLFCSNRSFGDIREIDPWEDLSHQNLDTASIGNEPGYPPSKFGLEGAPCRSLQDMCIGEFG